QRHADLRVDVGADGDGDAHPAGPPRLGRADPHGMRLAPALPRVPRSVVIGRGGCRGLPGRWRRPGTRGALPIPLGARYLPEILNITRPVDLLRAQRHHRLHDCPSFTAARMTALPCSRDQLAASATAGRHIPVSHIVTIMLLTR